MLNGLFAFAQTSRADHAADRLRDMLPTQVSVWRDGRRQIIEAEDVVVDDVLLFESGDRIPRMPSPAAQCPRTRWIV